MTTQPKEYKIGNVTCRIIVGDITQQPADAIIAGVPPDGPGEGGVAEAVRQSGAFMACADLKGFHMLSNNYMDMGDVLTTPSHGGSTKHVSFAASVCTFASGRTYNFPAVALSVRAALEDIAIKHRLSTANIPMMGTGAIGWLTDEQSARAMAIGIDRFVRVHPDKAVTLNFCVQTQEKAQALERVFTHPELYQNISDREIQAEKGQATPAVANLAVHRSDDSLTAGLRAAVGPKYVGRGGSGRY